MLSKPISAKVIFALALAILLAWAGHTSALFMGASQQGWSDSEGAHAHVHDEDGFACAACAGHYHSALTADHVHETPHLTTRLSVSTPPGRAQPLEAVGHGIPSRPIFLIERPPRALFVL